MATLQRSNRIWRSMALLGTGALLTLACTRVKVSWDQAASAAAPTATVAASAPALTAAAIPTKAQVEDVRSLSRTFAGVAEQVSPSVVAIRVAKKQKMPKMRRGMPFGFPFGGPFGGNPFGGGDPDEDDEGGGEEQGGPTQRGAGSGVVIDEKGYILTNIHVVGEADDF